MTTPGIIYMDGFMHYGAQTAHMLEDPAYTHIDSGYTITTPSWDGTTQLALTCQPAVGAQVCRLTLPATKTALLTNFWFSTNALASVDFYNWQDASDVVICKLTLNTDGSVSLRLADNTVLGTTDPLLQYAQLWQVYEMKLDCVAKTFEMHVDDIDGTDTPVLNLTSLAIGDGPIASTGLLPLAAAIVVTPKVYMKDLLVRDPAGSINNDFQGAFIVATNYADADGVVAWTPFYNGGPALGAYSTINKPNPTDLTYIEVSGDTVPVASNFTGIGLAVDTTIIAGVRVIQRSYTGDTDAARTQVSIIGPSGGVGAGSTKSIGQDPTYYDDIFEYDPDTSGPISPKTLINGQVRISRTL